MNEQIKVGTRIKTKNNGAKGTVVAIDGNEYEIYVDDERQVTTWTRTEFEVWTVPTVVRVTERGQLSKVATFLGVRDDWHEPDEYEVTAEVRGTTFDNAGLWGETRPRDPFLPWVSSEELHVVLKQDGEPVAEVNLADLFAWATGYNQ